MKIHSRRDLPGGQRGRRRAGAGAASGRVRATLVAFASNSTSCEYTMARVAGSLVRVQPLYAPTAR